jgi:CHAT domain-containing protein
MLNQPYSIVHIASHGEFGGNSDDTYLLTHEGRITMDQLADYVGATRFREQPLELITLSACETAAGDERSALGLAGLAIKSGARSALGTLWKVNDLAASDLIVSFYEALQEPGVSRAGALQRAQLRMLDDPRYRHPGYWAAFLLISDWL